MYPKIIGRAAVGGACLGLWLSASALAVAADDPQWTLNAAARQTLSVSPEMRAASAEVAAREVALDQAGAWPNPSIDLRADQKLGIEDGAGGTDLTQIALRQPLPLTRLDAQRRQAEAQLAAARERLRAARLTREAESARSFHGLQLAQARMALAEQRVAFVAGLQSNTGGHGARVVRFLTPIERARLAILREEAEQESASAEGKLGEAAARLRALLAVEPDGAPRTAPLAPAEAPPPLDTLLAGLDAHPSLAVHAQDIEAARAGADVARAGRWPDPTVGVFHERDFLNGARRDYSGVMLSVELPLWDRRGGDIARAGAEADQARERRAAAQRDLATRLRQGHVHLQHLNEQAWRYRERLLEPARRMLALTRRGFESGEQNVLALIDAYDTAFDAEVRYLELLYEAWEETAELRLAAGIPLAAPEGRP